MVYKIKHEEEADVLTIIIKGNGKLSHVKEVGDFIVHVDQNDEPLFWRYLKLAILFL